MTRARKPAPPRSPCSRCLEPAKHAQTAKERAETAVKEIPGYRPEDMNPFQAGFLHAELLWLAEALERHAQEHGHA